MAETPSNVVRRNRMIAIVASAITVVAIVFGFAGDFLELPWHWMRPAAELLLLAELVGLVVLERHQLFEDAPQILRQALLSGVSILDETPDLQAELQGWFNALAAFSLLPGSAGDARARSWSYRGIATVATRDGLDTFVNFLPTRYEGKVNC